jgi:hypothetical protein
MDNPVPQLRSFYIVMRNCATGNIPNLLAKISLRLYNGDVHTSHKHASSVFISRPLRAARIRKWLLAMDCVNNESPFSLEMKL